MQWLHSFTKSPSTRSSRSSSSSSSCPVSFDDTYTATNNDRRHRRRHGGWFRIHVPRSSRDKKLKSNQEFGSETFPASLASPSPSSCSSTAVPLPLPLPVPDGGGERGGGDGDSRFPSPKENIDRDHGRGDIEKDRKSNYEHRRGEEKNRNPHYEHVRSEDKDRNSNNEHRRIEEKDRNSSNVAIKSVFATTSAPISPFGSSPVLSPQRISNPDQFPYYYHMLKIEKPQVWSAPEMATYDLAGLPPPAYFDYTAFSAENSPLQSPNRSPRENSKSPNGPAPFVHLRLSLDNPRTVRHESSGAVPSSHMRLSLDNPTTIRHESSGAVPSSHTRLSLDNPTTVRHESIGAHRESNVHVSNVHPLPLPPGAGLMHAHTLPAHQVSPKSEILPMNNKWQKGKLIGRGTFGSVYVASNRETGALCAMKEVEMFPDDPKSAECIKQLEQEIEVLSHLKHPNIVQYYGSEIVNDKFNIYLEYVHPGSINKYIREHCESMTESIIRNFTRHILSGLAYLHSTKTVHRDIKGANLLVDAFGVVKLADFGMAKHLTGQRADLSLKGSPYWMAPELLQAVMQKDNNPDLAFAVDIWSLGCTIIEMFDGKPPWSEFEGAAALFKVMKDTPPIPETLSPEGKDFLRCCFQRNPAERPSASMLLEHKFFWGPPVDVSPCRESFSGMKVTDKA
ncbi:hypothetical protein ACFE04_003068 [Oxalis oulophora]